METDRMMAVKDAVYRVQLSLLEGIEDENLLFAAGSLMCCSDYQDVVTERTIGVKCGYPLCNNDLPSERPRKGKYRISLKEHKVYDLQETYSYCSTSCVVNSRAFAASLADERSSDLNPAKITEVLRLFERSSEHSKEDPGKNGNLRPSKLSIQEKTNATTEVSFEEWLGPSGAIEGYVPQKELQSKAQNKKTPREGSSSKSKLAQPKNENRITFSDMDFASTIITQDEYTVSKSPGSNSKSKLAHPKNENRKTFSDTDFTSTIIFQDEYTVSKSPGSSNTLPGKTNAASTRKDHCKGNKGLSKSSEVPQISVESPSDGKSQELNKLNGEVVDLRFSELTLASGREDLNGNGSEIKEQTRTGKGSAADIVGIKSSLKSSDSKKLNRSVTWANENRIIFSDTDRTSTILFQDEYTVSKSPGSPNTLPGKTNAASTRKDHCKGNKGLSKPLEVPQISAGSPSDGKSQESNKLNGEVVRIDDLRFSELTLASGGEDLNGNGFEIKEQTCTGKGLAADIVDIKSSLKSSDSKKSNCSVTWADERSVGNTSPLCEYKDSDDKIISVPEMEGNEESYRLASAEACADALMQVSDIVVSRKSDVSGAVSEVGLIILPPSQELDGSMPQEDDDNEDNAEPIPFKFTSKPGEPNYDLFDSDDSWFDGPPNGFSLELSPFATMFMALFSWISSSSLAYIYGRDESFHEEYLSVNGRDYPIKVVATDGRSSEIQITLSGCLSRALPGVVRDLRLPIPVTSLEKGMARLVDTMSFIDALPGFRMKQWQVIVLLFLDALSVTRIPALTRYMTGRRVLLPKVLDGASIKAEEYEIMKDLIIPLGRGPQFSSQCGG